MLFRSVTDYQVFDGSVLGGLGFPGVGPHDLVPFGVQNTAISFTLEVTNDLPEPGPVGVLALGVLGLVPVSRWRPRLHGAPAAAPRRATQGRL